MIRHTKRAERDLERAAADSLERWGEKKTADYMRELDAAILRLDRFRKLGPATPVDGYRALTVREHTVLYRLDGDTTWIVRVRSQRQRPLRQLR